MARRTSLVAVAVALAALGAATGCGWFGEEGPPPEPTLHPGATITADVTHVITESGAYVIPSGAFRLRLAGDGTVASIRIAFGGMAATPKRALAVEAALQGRPWTEAAVDAALSAFEADFTPLTDMRASAEYRMLAAKNLLRRFFVETTGTKAPVQVGRAA